MKEPCLAGLLAFAVVSAGCGGIDDGDLFYRAAGGGVAPGSGGGATTGGSGGSGAVAGSSGAAPTGGAAGSAVGTGGGSPGQRTPVSGECVRNNPDPCTDDSDCEPGGCRGEMCYGPGSGNVMTMCDCPAPTDLSCGCVAGECTWWR